MTDLQLIPDNEAERLAAVRRYDVLDTPPDGAFDRVTRLASRHFGVPISIVSIVDSDRIWFKSHHGIDAEEIGRDPGLCASAILGDEPWVIENAEADPRAMANPLVAGDMGLRFYAGAPLTTHDGHNLGTLCVIDFEPRAFTDADGEVLTAMADIVVDQLELRLAAREAVGQESALREQAEHQARELQRSLLPPELPAVDGAAIASLYLPADAGVVGGDFFDVFAAGDEFVLAVGDVSGKGLHAAAVTGLARHTIRAAAVWARGPAEVLANLNQAMLLGRNPGAEVEHYCTVLLVYARPVDGGLELRVGTAGHPPALLFGADGDATEIAGGGPPAGWHADAVYEERAVLLGAGRRLLLYTDGLTEARTGDGFLGIEGLADVARPARSAGETVAEIRRLVESGQILVSDDVAVLAVEVTG